MTDRIGSRVLLFSSHDLVVMILYALLVVAYRAHRLYNKAVFICCQELRYGCDVMF